MLTIPYPLNLACHYLPTPLPLPCGSATDRHTHPLRRSSDYPFLAQPPMCDAHIAAGSPAPVLRPRRRRAHVEGNIRSLSTIRRGVGRFGRGNSGSLAWCSALEIFTPGYGQARLTGIYTGAHTAGLGSRVAEVASDDCHGVISWVVCI